MRLHEKKNNMTPLEDICLRSIKVRENECDGELRTHIKRTFGDLNVGITGKRKMHFTYFGRRRERHGDIASKTNCMVVPN